MTPIVIREIRGVSPGSHLRIIWERPCGDHLGVTRGGGGHLGSHAGSPLESSGAMKKGAAATCPCKLSADALPNRSSYIFRERFGLSAAHADLMDDAAPEAPAAPGGPGFAAAWRNYITLKAGEGLPAGQRKPGRV